jgi:hypothetical protein
VTDDLTWEAVTFVRIGRGRGSHSSSIERDV